LGILGKAAAVSREENKRGTPGAFFPLPTETLCPNRRFPMSTVQAPRRTLKSRKRQKASAPPAVSAERVREMLREIAFVLHVTRIVGRVGEVVPVKE
jgi:hypothetical protein